MDHAVDVVQAGEPVVLGVRPEQLQVGERQVDGVADGEQEQHADQRRRSAASQPTLDGLKRLLSWRGPHPRDAGTPPRSWPTSRSGAAQWCITGTNMGSEDTQRRSRRQRRGRELVTRTGGGTRRWPRAGRRAAPRSRRASASRPAAGPADRLERQAPVAGERGLGRQLLHQRSAGTGPRRGRGERVPTPSGARPRRPRWRAPRRASTGRFAIRPLLIDVDDEGRRRGSR